MKIVFSRKGFDGVAGGVPSPIISGRPLSFPIPTTLQHTRFSDLREPVFQLVCDLTRGRINGDAFCHLDPDIDAAVTKGSRPIGWRGALGQVGKAQSHLRNRGVGPGDLFLFFGLFQEVERQAGCWRYLGKPQHAIFGWLQVAEVVSVADDAKGIRTKHPWLSDHAHLRDGWETFGVSPKVLQNTVYIAEERLSLLPSSNLPGFGTLEEAYILTASESKMKSVWRIPDWLNPHRGGTGLTFHSSNRYSNDLLATVGRGQEFVADIGEKVEPLGWLQSILAL
ncbi:hypothetical protein [Mesorhizobium sp. Cs1299R1N3]|uniref:Nmad3 family putative nucleotide modification protein n=1 Tax=Mesorhizobium sp. Cs1299R1N3 TaxID=3015173 RepID=UPI00301BD3C7